MRNNEWLDAKLNYIWQSYFSDIEKVNEVNIKFGRNARTRLGSIRLNQKSKIKNQKFGRHFVPESIITLSGYFKDERVPECVIDLTIAHELCHYAHGFSSPHQQLSKYPHQGGLVDKELVSRGFGAQLKEQKRWLKEEWPKIIGNNFRVKSRRLKVKRKLGIFDHIFS